jgi:hypothetical protein
MIRVSLEWLRAWSAPEWKKEKPAVRTGGIDDSGGVAPNALYQTPSGIEPRRYR